MRFCLQSSQIRIRSIRCCCCRSCLLVSTLCFRKMLPLIWSEGSTMPPNYLKYGRSCRSWIGYRFHPSCWLPRQICKWFVHLIHEQDVEQDLHSLPASSAWNHSLLLVEVGLSGVGAAGAPIHQVIGLHRTLISSEASQECESSSHLDEVAQLLDGLCWLGIDFEHFYCADAPVLARQSPQHCPDTTSPPSHLLLGSICSSWSWLGTSEQVIDWLELGLFQPYPWFSRVCHHSLTTSTPWLLLDLSGRVGIRLVHQCLSEIENSSSLHPYGEEIVSKSLYF